MAEGEQGIPTGSSTKVQSENKQVSLQARHYDEQTESKEIEKDIKAENRGRIDLKLLHLESIDAVVMVWSLHSPRLR